MNQKIQNKNTYVITKNYVVNKTIVEQNILGMKAFTNIIEALGNFEIRNQKAPINRIFIAPEPENDYVVVQEKEEYGGQTYIVIEKIENALLNKALTEVMKQGEIPKVKGKVSITALNKGVDQ